MPDHCKDHEANMSRGIENTACIAAIKRERIHQFAEMRAEAQELWSTVKSKLSTATFTWTIGILLVIVGGVFTAQWNLLLNISEKVDTIANIQAQQIGREEARTKR